jgi:hypothetical protein
MISFFYYKGPGNVGDNWSSPAHYFSWPEHATFRIGQSAPPSDVAIFGGGAIEPVLRNKGVHREVKARKRVAWGVGASAKGMPQSIPLVADLDLVGVREWGRERNLPGAWYVPCASCMLPLLDQRWPVTQDVVGFVNSNPDRPAPDLGDLPTKGNNLSIEEVIGWLGSAETVVTNSFHGVYWATLLGRRVVCIPYSSKFHGFKFPPTYATAETWRDAVHAARVWPEALEDCRRANRTFYARVREEIGF